MAQIPYCPHKAKVDTWSAADCWDQEGRAERAADGVRILQEPRLQLACTWADTQSARPTDSFRDAALRSFGWLSSEGAGPGPGPEDRPAWLQGGRAVSCDSPGYLLGARGTQDTCFPSVTELD